MKPAAMSQVLEQIVRIALIAVISKNVFTIGIEYAAAAAMVASVLGELVSLAYLFTMFKVKKIFQFAETFSKLSKTGKNTLQELMSVAMPATGSRMIGSLSWFFEPIVVSHSLFIAGLAAGDGDKTIWTFNGVCIAIINASIFYHLFTIHIPRSRNK